MADKLIRDVDIKHYFPNVIAPSLEFQELAKTEDIEFARIWPQAQKWFVNTYVYLLDIDGAKRWESMLGLRPDDADTLEQRKSAILAKINHSLPYTERKFQTMLNQQFGEGLVTSKVDYNAYKLNLEIYDDAGVNERNVYKYARTIVPANLGIALNLLVLLYVKSRHSLSTHLLWAGTQRYFSDNTGKTQILYWEGSHDKNGVRHTHRFDGKYRHDALEGDTKYKDDQKHFLEAAYQTEYSQAWPEIKHRTTGTVSGIADNRAAARNRFLMQDVSSPAHNQCIRTTAGAAQRIDLTQTSNGGIKQNKLDGSWTLDGSHTLNPVTRSTGMYAHSAKIIVRRNGIEKEEFL